MPIDASIPLQVQPLKLESPGNQLAMMSDAMKIGEMQRGIETQNKLRELYSQGVDVSTPEGFNKLASVDPSSAIKLRRDVLEGVKLQGDIKKTGVETDAKAFELKNNKINTAITRLANLQSPQEAAASIAEQVQSGDLPSERARQLLSELQSMPFQQFKTNQLTGILSAKDNLSNQLTKRGQDIQAGTARRGQDLTYSAATQPIFNEAVGGFVTRPTAANPSGTVIPLANPEATTKGQALVKGKNLVNDVATDMAASYGVLKDLGGIKSKENSPQKNISAALQSSMVGQVGGSMLGTPEQDARDAIMSQRPILVQAIVKATGIAASQINSNQELKNLLDAATDPSKGYETNIKSLNKINKRFGLGGDIIELPTAPAKEKVSVGAPQKTNPTIDALLKKYEEQ